MEKFQDKTYCNSCDRKTNHYIVYCHHREEVIEEYGAVLFDWDEKSYIVQCAGCDQIGFIQVYTDSEMFSYDSNGEMYPDEDVKVFPPEIEKDRSKHFQIEGKEFYKVPNSLLDLYGQIINAYNNQSYMLVGIGLRTMIEGMCLDLGIKNVDVRDEDGTPKCNENGKRIKSNKLHWKIEELVARKIILPKQAEVIHSLKDLGNQVVHEATSPSRTVLKKGIAIIEFMLEHTYDLEKYLIKR
ncbi:DUF4145 domain-containing protein [Bacillus wiedmannii]|uniref:DUF4145 domain-containing protein n=1 Tax=Bacillus wiedmannii TaxID=1890302 RepID=UPI00364EE737